MRLGPRDSFRVSLFFKALQGGEFPARARYLRDREEFPPHHERFDTRTGDRRLSRGGKRTAAFRTFVLMAGSEWTAAFEGTELAADRAKPGEIEINVGRLRFVPLLPSQFG